MMTAGSNAHTLWLWRFCEEREALSYLDYSLIINHLLHDTIKLIGKNFHYWCANQWQECTCGQVKFVIGNVLIGMKTKILERAKHKGLVVPKSWCRSRIRVGAYSTLTKLLGLSKESFRVNTLPEFCIESIQPFALDYLVCQSDCVLQHDQECIIEHSAAIC